jgi:hypothetical protein
MNLRDYPQSGLFIQDYIYAEKQADISAQQCSSSLLGPGSLFRLGLAVLAVAKDLDAVRDHLESLGLRFLL